MPRCCASCSTGWRAESWTARRSPPPAGGSSSTSSAGASGPRPVRVPASSSTRTPTTRCRRSTMDNQEPPSGPPEAAKRNGAADHLKPHRWKKGESGNPGGRPKGRSVGAALRELADTEHNGRALVDLLAERMMREALAGKFPFAKEVLERLDGKVTETHRVRGLPEKVVFLCPPPEVVERLGPADLSAN